LTGHELAATAADFFEIVTYQTERLEKCDLLVSTLRNQRRCKLSFRSRPIPHFIDRKSQFVSIFGIQRPMVYCRSKY